MRIAERLAEYADPEVAATPRDPAPRVAPAPG